MLSDDLLPGLRIWPQGRYLILYLPTSAGVWTLRTSFMAPATSNRCWLGEKVNPILPEPVGAVA